MFIGIDTEKDPDGVRAFFVLSDIFQVKSIPLVRSPFRRLFGVRDECLALLFIRQGYKEINDGLQTGRIV